MVERRIERTEKDSEGDILGVCFSDGDGKLYYTSKDEAIADIDSGKHRYYVEVDGKRVDVHTKHYLTTDPDPSKPNNLDNLPGCTRKGS